MVGGGYRGNALPPPTFLAYQSACHVMPPPPKITAERSEDPLDFPHAVEHDHCIRFDIVIALGLTKVVGAMHEKDSVLNATRFKQER